MMMMLLMMISSKFLFLKKNDKHFTLKGEKMMRNMNASY